MISDTIKYIGVNDHNIDLFEGQYPVPNGMAYNSYLILDEKVAIMDSVELSFAEEWFTNIRTELGDRQPDYLIVQHMEPDHSGSIYRFMEEFPEAKVVASVRAMDMIRNFFNTEFSDRAIAVKEKDTLSLGNRTLTFYGATMVHWPEVIVTYDDKDKVLFSADAFGKFGALDVDEPWLDEARRYYIGIVGKFGVSV
ncbi:MAG: MBL fold metallo-hydrolase, partial [Firmicutes bacterium]|nr:MBL fold metallo-hydrolase [Bacillota bacterium]